MRYERVPVLLIYDEPAKFEPLKRVVAELPVDAKVATTCKEAVELISTYRPEVVFSQSSLADGSWLSIHRAAEDSTIPLSVIVVADFPDTRKYVSVMERGAFDFVAPPFEREAIKFVTRSAALDAQRRRGANAPAIHVRQNARGGSKIHQAQAVGCDLAWSR